MVKLYGHPHRHHRIVSHSPSPIATREQAFPSPTYYSSGDRFNHRCTSVFSSWLKCSNMCSAYFCRASLIPSPALIASNTVLDMSNWACSASSSSIAALQLSSFSLKNLKSCSSSNLLWASIFPVNFSKPTPSPASTSAFNWSRYRSWTQSHV